MNSLHLLINAELRVLICEICQEGIPTQQVKGHLESKHNALSSLFNPTRFKNIVAELSITSELPKLSKELRKVVHGLAIQNALRCSHCLSIGGDEQVMQAHHQKHHKHLQPPVQWEVCKAQRWKKKGKGTFRIFWEVICSQETSQKTVDQVLLVQLTKELEEELQTVHIPKDRRLISPWLLTTGWHTYVESLNLTTELACQLVALPQSHEKGVEALSTAVETYFQEALCLIDDTDELVLQRLNSPDPTKRFVFTQPINVLRSSHNRRTTVAYPTHPFTNICITPP